MQNLFSVYIYGARSEFPLPLNGCNPFLRAMSHQWDKKVLRRRPLVHFRNNPFHPHQRGIAFTSTPDGSPLIPVNYYHPLRSRSDDRVAKVIQNAKTAPTRG